MKREPRKYPGFYEDMYIHGLGDDFNGLAVLLHKTASGKWVRLL
jgi:hypothetical protein